MVICFTAPLAFAEVPQAEPARPQVLQAAEVSRDVRSEIVDEVRYEREALERQADRQMQGVQDLFQLSLTALGMIVAVGVFVAGWFLWSTRRELRESIEKSIDDQVKSMVAEQASGVLDRLRVIEADIERLAGVGTRSVVWVTRDDDEAGGDVVAALRAAGIAGLGAVAPVTGGPFEIGSPELAIVSYDATLEGSRRLMEVLRQLQGRAPPVPLIVYTFNPVGAPYRIDGPDAEALSRYAWYVPTNFPLQLLAQVLSLLRRTPFVSSR
jgi:Pyruvate/2-oxoacid:ferredoxin oxidoreductase gamma subunit